MSKMPLLPNSPRDGEAAPYGSLARGVEDMATGVQPLAGLQATTGSASNTHSLDLAVVHSEPIHSDLVRFSSGSSIGTTNMPIRRSTSSSGRRKSRQLDEADIVALRKIAEEAIEGHYESNIDGRFVGGPGIHVAEGMSFSLEELQEEGPDSDHSSERSGLDDGSAGRLLDGEDEGSDDPVDNSPYAQVRASVSAVDNTALSINTPRMWTLSILFAVLGSSTNLFFSLRYPSVTITPVIALLLVHPLGLLWDQFLKRSTDPRQTFINGSLQRPKEFSRNEQDVNDDEATGSQDFASLTASRPGALRQLRLWLAQGQWNEKEHACVYISSNISFGFAFATDVIVEQTQFYHQDATILYQILLILSTQILGYAIAGITRRYLVRPSGMIWPATLMATSMFTTLHKEENRPANGWLISRWKFFMSVFLVSFGFYFLPGLLMPALSYFNAITWLAPNSVVVANLFGVSSGLGLFPLTFDWSQIAYIGSPLLVPFYAALNVVGGLVIVMWILAPILYYKNALFTSYMPILSSAVFDNTGKPYDVSKILTPDYLFDQEAYSNYSQVFLPITYVLSYALQFAAVSALIVHTVCWHGKDIWKQWRRSLIELDDSKMQQPYQPVAASDNEPSNPDKTKTTPGTASQSATRMAEPALDHLLGTEDVHNRLMRRYTDVPVSWYLVTGAVTVAVGIFVVEYYPVHLPWYGLLLALGLCTILFIPIGIVMATTNQQSSLYLICQLVCGAVFPGRGIANMVFVTYGYITSTQGMKFSSDLKLGHYMKIPPRLLFAVQMSATIVASFTQLTTLNWMLGNIYGICTPEALNGFTCPIARVHFNGSILWGVVGPSRFFGPGALYRHLVWAFLVGAVAPIVVWTLGKRSGTSLWRKVNLPVVFGSLSWIPPATGLNFSVWAIVCFAFNHVIKSRKGEWWRKYNFTLSAALDAGVACGVGVVFFGFVYPGWMENFKWWGTEVYKQGCDWRACPYKAIPASGHFGPDSW